MSEPSRFKHMRMIDALPEAGATIIVPANAVGRHVIAGIRHLRGTELARRCKTLTVFRLDDCAKLVGLRPVVLIYWTFPKAVRPEVVDRVEQMVRSIMVMVDQSAERGSPTS